MLSTSSRLLPSNPMSDHQRKRTHPTQDEEHITIHEQLFDAVTKNNLQRVKELLQAGAKPTWENVNYNGSVLDKAMENQNQDVIQLLLSHVLSSHQERDTVVKSVVNYVKRKKTSEEHVELKDAHHGDGEESKDDEEHSLTKTANFNREVLNKRIQTAVDAIRRGEFIMVFDGEDRENEGDLIIAAEKVTPEKIAFMVNETSGIICVGMEGERLDQLKLPPMVVKNTEYHGTAFTHSVDYRFGTTTGISAADRAITIRALTNPASQPDDFNRPGHVFPLRARPGGVLTRPGHTEASVDLARLAGLFPAGVMCEICNRDGSMARVPRLKKFATQHNMAMITIPELIEYRKLTESQVQVQVQAQVQAQAQQDEPPKQPTV